MESKFNDLVQFLIGRWDNVSLEVSDGNPVLETAYAETMVGKDEHTLTITAHEFRDGKDLTKDMHLLLEENNITLSQGDFQAVGHREGNTYYLKGDFEGQEFRFRLYTMGDKYVFHREIWQNGEAQKVDMSYLIRK